MGYKESKEWNCLNDIWKSMPKEFREKNMDNFKHLSVFIKDFYEHKVNSFVEDDDYKYLEGVSYEARHLVIDLINDGKKNLYHSVMSIIENHRELFSTPEDVWEYYKRRYSVTRPYIIEYETEVYEIIELCFQKMCDRGILKP